MAGTKRKQDDDSSEQLYSNKSRARQPMAEARVDPTYGQRSALPGLELDAIAPGSDDLDYNDDSLEAMNYLRSVR